MTWLLCDYGEVLCLPPSAADRAALMAAADWNRAAGEFWRAYWEDRPAYDRADLGVKEYWTRLLGCAPTAGQLGDLIAADTAGWLHPNRAAIAAAERAGERGLRLAILSNAPTEVADEIEDAPWLAAFGRRFFSCRLRAVKPDAAAYRAVLAALGAEPEEVVFFDDRPANVTGAARVGIDARLFEQASQLDEVS
jgi:putative hydrolase of the HAD superfamily